LQLSRPIKRSLTLSALIPHSLRSHVINLAVDHVFATKVVDQRKDPSNFLHFPWL
jgi:hypothetical protein